MLSWQGRLLKIYMRLRNQLHRPPEEMDIAQHRAELESLGNIFKTIRKLECQSIDADGVSAEWLRLPGQENPSVILYLHGGGYSSGSINSHRSLAGEIAHAAQSQALIIDYRLTPEHPFPAAVEDALKAYRWLLQGGTIPEKIVLAGDSAGGGLALALLIALRENNIALPAGAVCLSPWTDLTCNSDSLVTNANLDLVLNPAGLKPAAELYLAGDDPRTPLASPLFADLSGLPPLLIQVGSDEILLSDATSVTERAKRAGVEVTLEVWENMQHVWQFATRFLPEARQAIVRIGEFINKSLAA